ncbi:TPA: glutamine ABC transporter substrate-binding protein, partial [Streptococcus suis]
MKRKLSIFLLTLIAVFSVTTGVRADEYLRVGMEAAYAPFNWTQEDDSNSAVPIEG